MKELAVQGVLSSYRTLADGSLRVVIDLDEYQAVEFVASFRVNSFVAVARLSDEPPQNG